MTGALDTSVAVGEGSGDGAIVWVGDSRIWVAMAVAEGIGLSVFNTFAVGDVGVSDPPSPQPIPTIVSPTAVARPPPRPNKDLLEILLGFVSALFLIRPHFSLSYSLLSIPSLTYPFFLKHSSNPKISLVSYSSANAITTQSVKLTDFGCFWNFSRAESLCASELSTI